MHFLVSHEQLLLVAFANFFYVWLALHAGQRALVIHELGDWGTGNACRSHTLSGQTNPTFPTVDRTLPGKSLWSNLQPRCRPSQTVSPLSQLGSDTPCRSCSCSEMCRARCARDLQFSNLGVLFSKSQVSTVELKSGTGGHGYLFGCCQQTLFH